MIRKNFILLIIGFFCTFRYGIATSVGRKNIVGALFTLQQDAKFGNGTRFFELQFDNKCRCTLMRQPYLHRRNSWVWALTCLDVCVPHAHFCRCSTNYDYQTEVKNSHITAKPFIKKCQPRCICNKGYVWNDANKKCITIELNELYRKRFDFGIG